MGTRCRAFSRADDGVLSVCLGPGEPVLSVRWEFPFVSAVRWCAQRGCVLVTATPGGGRPPSVQQNDRGELALWSWTPGEGRWHRLYAGYAHDPVYLSSGGYAVHRGAGLTFVDEAGTKMREFKAGRFSWGPPSLSACPASDLVAWIRWRGDDRRLCLESPDGTTSADLRTSVHQYAWLDEETIIYYLGAGLRLLDIGSGRSRRLVPDLAALIGAAEGLPDRAARYLRLPAGTCRSSIRGIQVAGRRLWFAMTLFVPDRSEPRYTGLFARDLDTATTTLVADVSSHERIEAWTGVADGSALLTVARYEGTRIAGREQRPAGALAQFLTQGWRPMPSSRHPEFAFHAMP